MATGIPGKKDRSTVGDRLARFDELSGRIDYAAIQKQSPQVQMMILQQKEQELMQAQDQTQKALAQMQQQYDQGVESGMSEKELDEIKTEVDLTLAAGQKLSHQIQNVQEAKTEAENAARAEQSFRNRSTPTPGMS